MIYKVTYYLTSGPVVLNIKSSSSFKDFCQNEIKAIGNAQSSWYVTGQSGRFYFNPKHIIGVGFKEEKAPPTIQEINNRLNSLDSAQIPHLVGDPEKPQTITYQTKQGKQ